MEPAGDLGPYKAYEELFSPSLKKATKLIVSRGQGPYLYTTSGERYLDLVQGIAVNAFGHCHPELVRTASRQIEKLAQASFNLVTYPPALDFARALAEVTPADLDMFFFCNTGAEAVEGGLKLARYLSGKSGIIAFRGSFHGRTMGATSVTSSNVSFRARYAPFLPQVYFAPYPYCYRCPFGRRHHDCALECLEYLKQDCKHIIPLDDVSAILFEPVQGEGGYIVPPSRYVKAMAEWCRQHNLLVIFDEVQTGMGRTGKMFACEHFEVIPDILLLGKAVGGGYPLGVVAAPRRLMQQWAPGAHGTTFGGHPLSCAVGLAQLRLLRQPEFLDQVAAKGDEFRRRLLALKQSYPVIGDVRGLGLMAAIELVDGNGLPDPGKANMVVAHLFRAKILALTCGVDGNVIRFIPPLNIEAEVLAHVVEVLQQALEKLS